MKTSRIFASVLTFFVVLCLIGYFSMSKPVDAPSYVSYSGDALITQVIKLKFVADPFAKDTSISIKTFDGAVLLSGYAKNDQEKSATEGNAHQVSGVKSVKNEVTVRP